MNLNLFQHISIIFVLATVNILSNPINMKSPNGKLEVSFYLENGTPFYSVNFEDYKIIKESALGFIFKDSNPIQNNLKIVDAHKQYINEKWAPIYGTQDSIENKCNEFIFNLIETTKPERLVTIHFKVYNDGVGFRYEFPEQPNMNDVIIMDELTELNLSGDYTCWWIPGDYDSYEYLYNTTKFSEIDHTPYNYDTRLDRHHPNNKSVNTPITMETKDGIFLSFHEANLTDYAGMTLEAKDNFKMEVDLVPWADSTKVKTKVPFNTPWRTIQVAHSASELLKSNLILNLNEPNKLENVSWIEPMKYIGIWWEMHIGKSSWSIKPQQNSWANNSQYHGANTENAKRYIDFAANNNIQGILIEGWNTGWENWGVDTLNYFDFVTPYPDFDLEEIVKYAKEKGVEIIGHHETGGQAANYETHLENAFKLYKSLGIRAVKTGYAGQIIPKGEFHHGQYMVRHYRKVLEMAAKYGIMVDAHEPIKDTGIRRTLPNMMTREGVRGMEFNAWSDGNNPEHTTIIPFTRMLGGPIDYTPGIFDLLFDKYKDKERVYTTIAKQLALYVIIYSPLQMAADLIENYEGNPAFEFISKVPVNWNETAYLRSKIGDFVNIARRNGENWYLGSITDENARTIYLELSFLDKNKNYTAKIFKDGKEADWETNPFSFEIINKIVTSETTLRIHLAKGGGQAIIFEPIK